MEKYSKIPQEQSFVKSTNYLNYQVNVLQIVELQNVVYYQFKTENAEEYRILWDGNLTIKTLKGFAFHINTQYRFDKNNDSYFEISNGLGFQF